MNDLNSAVSTGLMQGFAELWYHLWWVLPLSLFMAYLNGLTKRRRKRSSRRHVQTQKSSFTPRNENFAEQLRQMERSFMQSDSVKSSSGDQSPKQKGDAYEAYVAEHFRAQGYTVAEHGLINGYKDKGIDLIVKKERQIILIQCKNWSQSSRYRINHEKVKAFVGDTAFYLEDNPMYADYELKRLYVVSNPVLDRSAINYIKSHQDKIRYLHLPMPKHQ